MDLIDSLNTALADRYELEREIGRGGMATVYLARDIRHERNVALKVLSPELGAVLGAERFLAEIRVTANLQHPNLLPLFDSGEANGLLFYVMPFVVATLDVSGGIPRVVRTDSLFADVYRGGYSLHPDGKGIAVLRDAGQGTRLVIVTNWLGEARAKLRNK